MKQSFLFKRVDQPVSPIVFGTVNAGSAWDGADADRMLNTWLDHGGNLVDTARVYTDGESERVLGDFFRRSGRRQDVVLISKGGHPLFETMHTSRMSQQDMEHDLHASLKAMQTDYIDIYFYHRDDLSRPVGELLDRMEGFRQEGKIRYYACSNWTTARMKEADDYAAAHDLDGFVGNQALYNIGSRHMLPFKDDTMVTVDNTMLDYHRESGNVLMPYFGVCSGFFHVLEAKGINAVQSSPYCTDGNLTIARKVDELCKKYNASITQVLLGFFLTHDFPIVPLAGSDNLEQLMDMMKTPDIAFDPKDFVF